MRKISFALFLLTSLTLFCCKDNPKEEKNSENSMRPEESTNLAEEEGVNLLTYVPAYQENKPIEQGDNYPKKHVLSENENYFKIDNDIIHVVIPNSDSDMKIKNVFNVSDYNQKRNLNAIVIHISNGRTLDTKDTVTHKLISDLKISEIDGLSNQHLKDKQLKVFVINEDFIDEGEKTTFTNCAKQELDYSHMECNLITGRLYEKDNIKPLTKPREQEGDIIIGG